jgi:hypothetical protein
VTTVEWACEVARDCLAEALPRRWRHVQAVVERARILSSSLGADDAEHLVAAAWLHDVGYAPGIAETGFHPLDGARYLRKLGCPERVCNLVAFHSCASAEAKVLGLVDGLREFSDEPSLLRDLLWYADMTTGPDGQCMTFPERMNEIRSRYGPDHYVVRALDAGMAERETAVARAREWIESAGLAGQV